MLILASILHISAGLVPACFWFLALYSTGIDNSFCKKMKMKILIKISQISVIVCAKKHYLCILFTNLTKKRNTEVEYNY